jgi:autotransporter-associated beta strand protein
MRRVLRFRVRTIAAAALAVLGPPAMATMGPTFAELARTPAVQQAYLGAATPAQLAAAMAGWRELRGELHLIGVPAGGRHRGGSGSVWISMPGEVGPPGTATVIGAMPSPRLLTAASDADLGTPAAPVTLAHARLQLLGSFETARDFVIGHPGFAPDHVPTELHLAAELSIQPASSDVYLQGSEPLPAPPPAPQPPIGGPGWIDTHGHDLKITGVVTSWQRLHKEGAGTLWLTGANVWHAVPVVEAGVLQGDALSLATDIVNRGWVSFAQASDATWAQVVSGSGGLRKLGAGALTLTAIQTYRGATEVDEGTLRFTLGDALLASASVAIGSGALVDAGAAFAPRLRNLEGSGRLHFARDDLAGSTLTLLNDRDSSYAGVIAGPGELQVSGSQTLTLSGANLHAGGTRVSGGRLAIASDAALGAAAAPLTIDNDGRLTLLTDLDTARPWVVGHGVATVDTGAHALVLRAPLAGHALSLTKRGSGKLSLAAASGWAGEFVLAEGRLTLLGAGGLHPGTTLRMQEGTRFDLAGADGDRRIRALHGAGAVELGGHTLVLAGGFSAFAGTIGGSGGLSVDGAATLVELHGNNTYTGVTTVHAGTLRARPGSLSERVVNHGRLELFDTGGPEVISAYSGDISGDGQLVKTGDAVVWLRGHNSHRGGTRVEAGVLIGNTASLPGDIETHAGLAFYQTVDGTHAGRISGSGTLLAYGPGALTLAADNTHRGGTAFSNVLKLSRDANLGAPESALLIAGGTLVALDDLALARRVVAGSAGARFDSHGHDIRIDRPVDGPGGLTKLGAGVLHLSGAQAYAGATVVAGGGLVIDGSVAGDVEVRDGARLHAAGRVGGDLRVDAGGTLGAGLSPGRLEVAGDLQVRGLIRFEIASATAFDQILVAGFADLADATLHFELLPGARAEDAFGLSLLSAAGGLRGVEHVNYSFGAGLDQHLVAFDGLTLQLSPVPEPEAWAMLLAGLGLLGWVARRRLTPAATAHASTAARRSIRARRPARCASGVS